MGCGYLWPLPEAHGMRDGNNEMTFLEHLEELRWTLVRSAMAVVVGMVAAFVAKTFIFDTLVLAPKEGGFITYRAFCAFGRWLGTGDAMCLSGFPFELQNISMSGQFFTHLMVSFVVGLVVASPFVFWEIWRFLAPGLKASERAAARGAVLFASFLFLLGIAFGYFLLTPLSIQFFGSYQVSASVTNTIALDSYIAMLTSVTLWTGIAFELPLVVMLLTRLGLISPPFLRTHRKHAFVLLLIISAILTPPDVVSQIIVTLPLMLLYELGIALSVRTLRRMEAAEQAVRKATPGTATR